VLLRCHLCHKAGVREEWGGKEKGEKNEEEVVLLLPGRGMKMEEGKDFLELGTEAGKSRGKKEKKDRCSRPVHSSGSKEEEKKREEEENRDLICVDLARQGLEVPCRKEDTRGRKKGKGGAALAIRVSGRGSEKKKRERPGQRDSSESRQKESKEKKKKLVSSLAKEERKALPPSPGAGREQEGKKGKEEPTRPFPSS